MKVLFLLASLVATAANASTLKIPLVVEDNNKFISISKINKQYKLQGIDKIQEVLVISNTDDSISKARDAYWTVREKVEVLAERFNKEFFLATTLPGKDKIKNLPTCYVGSADEAVEIASNMNDSVYSDQLGIFGYKYKKQTTFLEGQEQSEMEAFLNDSSAAWRNWNSSNDDILVLSHEGDGGDDVNEGILVKCK